MSGTNVWILQELQEIERKLTACRNAKRKFQAVKGKLQAEYSNYSMCYNRMNSKEELIKIKQTDKFEGEMANELCRKMAELNQDLSVVLKASSDLVKVVGRQCTNIDNKINELETRKTYLEGQL